MLIQSAFQHSKLKDLPRLAPGWSTTGKRDKRSTTVARLGSLSTEAGRFSFGRGNPKEDIIIKNEVRFATKARRRQEWLFAQTSSVNRAVILNLSRYFPWCLGVFVAKPCYC